MVCELPRPIYANPPFRGLKFVNSRGDGYTIDLEWFKAIPPLEGYDLAYNIYYSTEQNTVFDEGVKFVIIDADSISASLTGFIPGDVVYFAVRATLHDEDRVNLALLPSASNGYKVYPEGLLNSSITDESLFIPVSDVDQFPPTGVVQIGVELIGYSSRDLVDGYLIVANLSDRGLFNTEPRLHDPDGYDGYKTHDNPLVRFFKGFEEDNINIVLEENKFDYPNHARTNDDGYRVQEDLLTTDMSTSDANLIDFPRLDRVGWRRTDTQALLRGECVGSYFGGEQFCADGYEGVGRQTRGISLTDVNNQREEFILEHTGESVVLFRRMWEGITCSCVNSSRETPEHRCGKCFGTSFIGGYTQYYNSRRSDGRILIRIDPTVDDLLPMDAGLESDFKPTSWTLASPTIKDRDFIVRFGADGLETWRYEVLNVTRNVFFLEDVGAQKMALIRVRKTDPIYQVPMFGNTATMPTTLTTSIGMVSGPGGIPPHMHEIVISENIVSLVQINQMTGIAADHNHAIIDGTVIESLGHTHSIILP